MVINERILTSILVLLCVLLNGCDSTPPSDKFYIEANNATIEAAKASAAKSMAKSKYFGVICSGKKSISPAEHENGIELQWCMTVGFIGAAKVEDKWVDEKRRFFVTRENGKWKTEESTEPNSCGC